MKCPKCNSEAEEVKIKIFESLGTFGSLRMGIIGISPYFDIFGLVSLTRRGVKKAKLAIQDKKLYRCTNEKCQHEFEA